MSTFLLTVRRNLKSAFKSVWHERKQYACFLIALLIIQTVLWSSVLSMHIRRKHAYAVIESNFDYHLCVSNLNEYTYPTLFDALSMAQARQDGSFRSFRFEHLSDGTYSCYVLFKSPLSRSYANFEYNYLRSLIGKKLTLSPLYTFGTRYLPGIVWSTVGLCAFSAVFSVLILMWLYTIRLKHFSFLYSIYMTCGADFGRLYETAAYEMVAAALYTALPSVGLSVGLVALFYTSGGVAFSFSFWGLLVIPLLTVGIVLAATFFPMKRLSRTPPIELLKTADNSSLARSPRHSRNLLFKKLPSVYERVSFIRFRTYFALLISGAVLFSSAFLCLMFLSGMQRTREETVRPEVTLTFTKTVSQRPAASRATEYMDAFDSLATEILALPSSGRVDYAAETYAPGVLSRLLVRSGQVLDADDRVVGSTEVGGYPLTFNRFRFVGTGALQLQMLKETYTGQIEGDPDRILYDDGAVILSESLVSSRAFSFKPGDTVMLALPAYDEKGKLVLKDGAPADATFFYSDREILSQQMERYEFTYTACTVAAVIHNEEPDTYLSLCLNRDAYRTFTKNWAVPETMDVYPAANAELKDIHDLQNGLTAVLSGYNGFDRTDHLATLSRVLAGAGGVTYLMQVLACALLLFSPLVWFFSQFLFFERRFGEWEMLESLGARRNQIRRAHLYAGLLTAFCSLVLTFALGYGLSYLVYWLSTTVLPAWGFIERIPYSFGLPVWQVGLCVFVSVLCGFFSAYIPYLRYRRRASGIRIRDDIH